MRVRLNTLLGLMGAIACIAVAIGAYVADESDTGSPTVGLAIVVASTAAVAAIITAASNSQSRADAQTVPVVRLLMTILKSCPHQSVEGSFVGWPRCRPLSCCWDRT
jgi:hypothetical protein